MNIRPLRNFVVIKPDEEKEFTSGGIYLPGDINDKKSSVGTVMAVGPGIADKHGNRTPIGLNIGDKVMYNPNDLGKYKINDEYVYILIFQSIIGILS